MRLLLAEDEKEMAHALEAVFTHNHYSVDVVYNGIDAADWAESGNYDGMILDIMMPGKSGLEVLSEWTESIYHQIERLNSLVIQLLTLAKMEEGGGKLELKTWNASETIIDAVTSFEAPAVTKQIALQSDIAEELHMEGDAARIHQLVSLLVDNAVKYTPEGGKIHIFWRKNGKKAEIKSFQERKNKRKQKEEYMMFDCGLQNIFQLKSGQSRSINWENRNGEKGKGGMASSDLGPSRKGSPCIPKIEAGETVTLGEIQGEGIIQHIWITVTDRTSERNRYVLRDLVLRMYWDDEEFPSVECPLGDFFCCGFGVSYQVNSVPIAVNPTRGFNSYFPMPFRKNARITIENQCDEPIPAFFYQIDYCLTTVPEDAAYFHAQWRRQRITEKAKDYIVLDNIKGKGQYVGTYLALTSLERYWYGEGEMKFYIDGDKDYPTICGTGTEDYFGGAWSFATQQNGQTVENQYCTPYLGYPYYSTHDTFLHNDYHNDDQMPQRSFYRWHLLDPILFEKDLKVTLQQIGVSHGGLFERQDDVATTAYWYQTHPHVPFAPLMSRKERWPR